MKPSINQSTIMQCDTGEFIKICSQVGFKEVELRVPKVEEYLIDRSCKELRALLRKHNLHVATLNSLEFFSLVPEENFSFMLKKAEEMMILCQLIECDVLIVVPSKNPFSLSSSEIKTKTIQRLQELADLGKSYGVKVSFEPIGPCIFSIRKVLDGLDIVREIRNQKVALTIDTFNFYVGENTINDLKKVPGDMISFVHFHDVADLPLDKLNDEHRLFPGEGIMDLKGMCEVFRDKGYQGPLSVELFNPKLWEMPPQEVASKAWKSLRRYL